MKIADAIKSSFGFFTIIPVKDDKFDRGALNFMWFQYMLAGIFAAIIYIILSLFLNFYLAAVVAFISIGIFLGIQNVDALADFGDGLMKRGSPDERFAVMKTPETGTGGIFSVFSVYVISIAALLSLKGVNLIYGIIFGQLNSALWMVVIISRNKTRDTGFAHYFSEITGSRKFLVWNILPILIVLIIFFPELLLIFLISVCASLLFRIYSVKVFGAINGDITGASGEIGRMTSLVLMNAGILILNPGFNLLPYLFRLP